MATTMVNQHPESPRNRDYDNRDDITSTLTQFLPISEHPGTKGLLYERQDGTFIVSHLYELFCKRDNDSDCPEQGRMKHV